MTSKDKTVIILKNVHANYELLKSKNYTGKQTN